MHGKTLDWKTPPKSLPPEGTGKQGWKLSMDRVFRLAIIYRWVCIVLACVVLGVLWRTTGTPRLWSTAMLYPVYATLLNLLHMKKGRGALARWMLLFDYFYVLLNGYFTPSTIWTEFLFLPVILMDIVLTFPALQAIVLETVLGIVGSVALSYNLIGGSTIMVNGISFPFSLVSVCFYTPISLGMIVLAMLRFHREQEQQNLLELKELNHRLDAINRNISQKLFSIQQDSSQQERMRITKEIHDTAGYVFINVIMLLQASLAVMDKDRTLGEAKINDALDYTRRGMNEIRYILREMRAYEKPSLGLQNELYDIARLFTKATGVTVNMEYGNWRKSFGQKFDAFFVSFLQESLTNALKHGHATVVEMICWETGKEVMITVRDNGKGTSGPLLPGIGLTGIKDFVETKAGQVTIEANDPLGFSIRVVLPATAMESGE